ncbi:glycerate kinase type-2 family protein [Vandammella animalimorsus]|uniref:Glycerate kinase n=1 Tax=Vandammella animalimorsus TaxID=2029117 RepID=A0A2A2AFF1_9BURK|nr:glycerate kinase [Vandammella animalimorsus]PAT37290.1 glycerate kinase [Vandammella animalimorsus]
MTPSIANPPALLRQLLDAAIAAAQPAQQLARHLPPLPPTIAAGEGRVLVLGAGKASAAMAAALEQAWPQAPLGGLVATRYGHAAPCRRIEIVQAAHPVPDAAGQAAAQRMLALAHSAGAQDLVVCLFSGGGSALLPLALPGLTLADKQALSQALLRSGASIQEMNCVRRHLSAIKGGRLALACAPAPVLNLLISDVPGDEPADIASGPSVPDASSCAQALDILQRYHIAVPEAARQLLQSGAGESIAPGDARLPAITTRLIATPQQALQAAAAAARQAGLHAYILGDALEGQAAELARALAGMARYAQRHAPQPTLPWQRPCVLLSGGETTVTLAGNGGPAAAPRSGRGGRNAHFLLALALALRGAPGIHALAADTDGVDGSEAIAGACIGPDTLQRARQQGLSAQQALDGHDAHRFFEALGDAIVTGPTRTNVNDFRAILIL